MCRSQDLAAAQQLLSQLGLSTYYSVEIKRTKVYGTHYRLRDNATNHLLWSSVFVTLVAKKRGWKGADKECVTSRAGPGKECGNR